MADGIAAAEILSGGGWLVEPVGTRPVFTRDQLSDEQQMFFDSAADFMRREVHPLEARIEAMEPGLLPSLLKKAAEVGLLSIDIPEEFGGLGLDKTTSALVTQATATQGSFGVAIGVQTGIGTLPILIFGTPEQKQRYLPELVAARRISAYCLSEPDAGSDALSARTTAVPVEGGYLLNGTKQWISNAGFADVFIVFARIPEVGFSCFIVDGHLAGVSTGAEEHKMGLKGSSTRQVILENVLVPRENLLGAPGKGHVIAFNILNIGRYKLGLGAMGAARPALTDALTYALARKQFANPLSSFPAIQEKLAGMVTRIYATESMGWRLTGMIDARIEAHDKQSADHWQRAVEVISDYAVEASILKVYGTEALAWVLDEALQIHGGNGFTREYPIERPYRDARVNRIFEGTNEINRLLIPGTLLKRAMQGKLALLPAMMAVQQAARSDGAVAWPEGDAADIGTPALETAVVAQLKQVFLYVAGTAANKYQAALEDEQEVLLRLADIAMEVYAADSVVARLMQTGSKASAMERAVARVVVVEAVQKVGAIARSLAARLAGKPARMAAAVDRMLPYLGVDAVVLRRQIAAGLIEAGRLRF